MAEAPAMALLDGKTILQVIPELSAGGAERTAIEVAEAIVLAGGRALVASHGGRMEQALLKVGGELVRMDARSKNPLILAANALKLAQIVRERGVNLIHARSRAPGWSALWAARRTHIPFVTTYHGAYTARNPLKRAYNAIMAKGDVVIANSQWIADHLSAEHGVPPARVVTIPRGVDADRMKRSAVTPARLQMARERLGLIQPDTFQFIMPARLTGWKGQREAIMALAALPEGARRRAVLVLAGDAQGRDDYAEGLVALARRLGIDAGVKVLGHVDDIGAQLCLADVMVSAATEPEAFGRSAAEAAAMELPVIATDHGGAREVVRNGVSGLLIAPGDVDALSGAMKALMDAGAAERAQMGAAGRAFVEANFSTRALQSATIRTYISLLSRGDGRPGEGPKRV
jgi:glycosyltransferase involved in cell wall biosynthesis